MIQFKKKMRSGQTCTGEKGDKRCQLGRASSELLMAALFRFSFSSLSCYFLSSLFTFPQLTVDIWSTSFNPRLLVLLERMRVGMMPLLTTGWGYVSNIHPPDQIKRHLNSDQSDCMKIFNVLHRHQWPSMWFCLWTLQGIFLQGLSTQTQMSPCHLVSGMPINVSQLWMVICTTWWIRSMKIMNQDHLPSCIAWPMASPSLQWPGGRERLCCLSPQSVTDKRNSPSVSGEVRSTFHVT